MGIEMNETKVVPVVAKTLKVCAKCSDCCFASLHDQDGRQIGNDIDGYVPSRIGIGGGDYVKFTLDLETGQIINWTPPSAEALEAAFMGDDD